MKKKSNNKSSHILSSFSFQALAAEVTVLNDAIDGYTHSFGMDHRAITWCHNVLSVVRKVVDIESKHDLVETRIGALRSLLDFDKMRDVCSAEGECTGEIRKFSYDDVVTSQDALLLVRYFIQSLL